MSCIRNISGIPERSVLFFTYLIDSFMFSVYYTIIYAPQKATGDNHFHVDIQHWYIQLYLKKPAKENSCNEI